MGQRVCRAIEKVHDQIAASVRPDLPLMWTEWNVPSFGPSQAGQGADVTTYPTHLSLDPYKPIRAISFQK
jgi:hypothetical protein